jgi:hypothetical protein
MKVDKDQFDALLGKLMQAPPQPSKDIKGQPGNLKPILSKPAPSEPRKA